MQLSIGAASLIALILFSLFFPETSQPHSRGIDKLRAEGHGTSESSLLLGERDGESGEGEEKFKWVWLNPFGFMGLLRSPNVLAVVICSMFVLMAEHLLLNPLAYTLVCPSHKSHRRTLKFTVHRVQDTESIMRVSSACASCHPEWVTSVCPLFSFSLLITNDSCIPVVGAPIAGRLSDMIIVRARAKRGTWVPEDRLRASVPAIAVLVPVSLLAFGLTIKFIPGTAGLVVCLVLLFIHGVGVRVSCWCFPVSL